MRDQICHGSFANEIWLRHTDGFEPCSLDIAYIVVGMLCFH